MSVLNRREFLKMAAFAGGASVLNMFTPRFVLASGGNNKGRNLVLVNLIGGHDDKYMFPYIGSLASSVAELRPTLAVNPGSALAINGELGLNPSFGAGFHNIHAVDGRMKLITMAGIPNNTGSHNDDSNIMSLGRVSNRASERAGFLARLMDTHNMEPTQVIGFGAGGVDFYGTEKQHPLSMNSLNGFQRWKQSNADGALIKEIAKQLLELPIDASPKENAVRRTMRDANLAIARIASYSSESVNGQYSGAFGSALRDSVKVLKSKKRQGDSANTIIYTAYGGLDTHSDERSRLNDIMGYVGPTISTFVDDLKAEGLWDSTVIYFFSEFGRTNAENGGKGTDHGSSTTHVVLGGSVNGGGNAQGGPLPTPGEFIGEPATAVAVDFRNVYSEIFSWMGFDSSLVYTEPYTKKSVGLFV